MGILFNRHSLARVSYELGGKGANIIFDDVDMERAIKVSLRSSFYNQGEVCLAGSRILVQRGIYNEFLERFADATTAHCRPGDPMNPYTTLGALISTEHWERVMEYINGARETGEIILGGSRPDLPAPFDKGNFLNATIITNVTSQDTVCQEKIFGPAVTVIPFDERNLLNPEDKLLLAKAAEHDVIFINLLALPYMALGTIRNLVGHLGHWAWRWLFVDHSHVLFTSFGNPYILHEMPHLPNLLAAYGNSEVSQRAAVKVWLGEIEAQGNCPVRLPKISIQPLAPLSQTWQVISS